MKAHTTLLNIPLITDKLYLETHSTSDLVSEVIEKEKIWEPYETRLFIKHIKKGDCVLDIGANIGYYSLIASKLVKDTGMVIAFEPEQENFVLLKKNIELNQLENIHAYNAGLGDTKRKDKLYINTLNRGDHRGFEHEVGTPNAIQDIQIMTGDELNLDKLDFIKIDTQGFEHHIICGLRECINKNQNHLRMIVEFWPFALKKNKRSANALIDELSQYAFKVSIIDHIHHQLIKTDWDKLRHMVKHELTCEKQGFINLWLEPA